MEENIVASRPLFVTELDELYHKVQRRTTRATKDLKKLDIKMPQLRGL